MINLAFQTMKNQNHQMVENIEYSLWKIGNRNVWENPNGWNKTSFKLSVARRLSKAKDMYCISNTSTILELMMLTITSAS